MLLVLLVLLLLLLLLLQALLLTPSPFCCRGRGLSLLGKLPQNAKLHEKEKESDRYRRAAAGLPQKARKNYIGIPAVDF